jgi:hypothetical protein
MPAGSTPLKTGRRRRPSRVHSLYSISTTMVPAPPSAPRQGCPDTSAKGGSGRSRARRASAIGRSCPSEKPDPTAPTQRRRPPPTAPRGANRRWSHGHQLREPAAHRSPHPPPGRHLAPIRRAPPGQIAASQPLPHDPLQPPGVGGGEERAALAGDRPGTGRRCRGVPGFRGGPAAPREEPRSPAPPATRGRRTRRRTPDGPPGEERSRTYPSSSNTTTSPSRTHPGARSRAATSGKRSPSSIPRRLVNRWSPSSVDMRQR